MARRVFELEPSDPLASEVAIVSDEREGFYRWWAFARGQRAVMALLRA